MLLTRVIPCLLLHKGGLVKTVKFKNPRYVGDPIVAVKIFNDKEVDELVLLDISAGIENRPPNFERIAEIATEAFMPVAYGGAIRTAQDAEKLFKLGIEKVVINTAAAESPQIIRDISTVFGSQAVIVSIDVKKGGFFGKSDVYVRSGHKAIKRNPVDFAKEVEQLGAGEIMITSIDQEGSMAGYDLELTRSVSEAVQIPVIASGGAGSLDDFQKAVKVGKASAVSAGSFFVFHGRHRAVLINYPERVELEALFGEEAR